MNINKILILTVFVTEELPCTFTKISLIRKRELKSVTRLELTLIRTQRSVDMADDRTQYEEVNIKLGTSLRSVNQILEIFQMSKHSL